MFKIVKKSTWEKLNDDSNDLKGHWDQREYRIGCLSNDNSVLSGANESCMKKNEELKSQIRKLEKSEAELIDKLDMVKDEYKQLKSEMSKTIKEITASKVKADKETEKIRNEYNVLKSHADLITEDNKALRVSAQNLDTIRGQMNDIRHVLATYGKKLPKEVYEVHAKYFNNENKK